MIRITAILLAGALSGCCWMAKRSCFPACPPVRVLPVEKQCALPPKLHLPAVRRVERGCPENHACFDAPNAAFLATREAEMKDWIREVRLRCGKQPTSQPVE
jgi:hypothetical protein